MGDILSLKNKKYLKSNLKQNGYVYIMLYKNDGGKTHRVHRLVAESYLENNDNKPQVNHIDGNKSNNNVNNLEWCTQSENQKHAISIGLDCVPITTSVYDVYKNSKFVGRFYNHLDISKETGLSLATIGRMFQFNRQSRNGYSIILIERATTKANACTL
jgi:hypothetical protein